MIAALHDAYAEKTDPEHRENRGRGARFAPAVGHDGGEGVGSSPLGPRSVRDRRMTKGRQWIVKVDC